MARRLAWYFHRNGYVRRHSPERRKEMGRVYKKGDEVRLVAASLEELRAIRSLVEIAEFKAGKLFRKGRQYSLPIYGVEATARFLKLVGRKPQATRKTRTEKRSLRMTRNGH